MRSDSGTGWSDLPSMSQLGLLVGVPRPDRDGWECEGVLVPRTTPLDGWWVVQYFPSGPTVLGTGVV